MANRNLVVALYFRAKDEVSSVLGGMKGKVAAAFAAIATYVNVRLFAGALSSAAEFEAQLSKVQAVSRANAEDLARLRAAAEDMGARTRFTATQAAEGLEVLARAGLDATESIAALPAVLALAQGNSIDLASAASLVTRAASGMGIAFTDSARVADVLALAAASANTSAEGLGLALSYVAPTARAAGLELEDITALVAKLADAGIDASRAGTSLNNILAQFQNPASRFRQELGALGIVTDDFGEALRQLEVAGPRARGAILALGQEAGPAMRALLGQGIASVDDLARALRDAEGAAQQAADTMDDNLLGAWEGLKSAWDALRRTLVDPLLEPIKLQVQALSGELRRLVGDGSLDAFRDGLVAAFHAGVEGVKTFLRDFRPEEWLAAAGRFVTSSIEYFGRFSAAVSTLGNGIKTLWFAVYQSVALVMGGVTKAIAVVLSGADAVVGVLNRIGLVSDDTANRAQNLAETFHQAADEMIAAGNRAYEDMKTSLTAAIESAQGVVGAHRDIAAAAEHSAERQAAAAEAHSEALSRQITEFRRLEQALADGTGVVESYESAAAHAARTEREAADAKARLVEQARAQQTAARELLQELEAESQLIAQVTNAEVGILQAKLATARARKDEVAVRQLTNELARAEARQARQLAEAKAGEAAEARALADAIRAELDASEELDPAKEQEYRNALRNAEAKAAEADEARALADAKRDLAAASGESARGQERETEEQERSGAAIGQAGDLLKRLVEIKRAATEQAYALSDAAGALFERLLAGNLVAAGFRGAIDQARAAASATKDEFGALTAEIVRQQEAIARFDLAAQFGNSFQRYEAAVIDALGRTKIAYAREMQELIRIEEQLEKIGQGGTSAFFAIEQAVRALDGELGLLGEQDLARLRQALDDARRRMEALEQSAQSAQDRIAELDARLARLRGDEETADRLRRELELNQALRRVEDEREQARQAGNHELLRLLDEEERKLRRIADLENRQERERRRDRPREHDRGTDAAPPSRPAGGAGEAPGGGRLTADLDYERLAEAVARANARSLGGQDIVVDGERLARAIRPHLDDITRRSL